LVEELVGDLLGVLQEFLANSLFPLLQPAVGVGSTFEGWSPNEDQAVYRLLVPLRPPHGHAFHLELGTSREILAKGSRVRVELECTCTWEQLVENTPCFLHYPEEELRRKPSLLSTLCSGSYLDVQKTARWLQNLVRSAWLLVPQSRHYNMKVLPSSRSCKLQLTNIAGVTLCVELLFGVQQGSSDIFLSSQAREAIFTPSTMWPESYAVAEAKFFRHMALHDTCHLKCLQVCTRILMGTGFSNYIMKTVVMHLLNTIPPSRWSREEFLLWLQHIMEYLHGCLEEKRLNHFFFGNENVPKEIVLPPTFELAEPLNLFQHLLHDKHAHAKALLEFDELQDR
ncbi:IPIL1 protein, partial [Chionis minor]|nr:IPIL1 protein [Chionis minor]